MEAESSMRLLRGLVAVVLGLVEAVWRLCL